MLQDNMNVDATPTPSNLGTFALLSDTHLDPFYGTPYAEIHNKGAPCNLTNAPTNSAYGCGGSLALVTAAISAASTAIDDHLEDWPPLDFILFTGDNTRHNSQNSSVVLQSIATVQGLFQEYFPNVTVIELPALDLGNNDVRSDYYLNVTSHEPCLPGEDGSLPIAANEWLESVADQQSDIFASELEKATFSCGGYLNRAISDKLHIITLNTIVWSSSHTPVPSSELDKDDPFGQFAWLDTELTKLHDEGKKVYITGHVPPMLQSFTGSLGRPLYPDEKQVRLLDMLAKYEDVVSGFFMAHVHSNELRHISSFSGSSPPLIISGSIAPCYTTDPTFSMVQYDREGTSQPVDIATFKVDLGKDAPMDDDTNTNPFKLMTSSLVNFLGIETLSNDQVLKLSNDILTDEDTWNKYFYETGAWYKGASQTACDTYTCKRAEACLVACGFYSDSWQSCNASSNDTTEVACKIERGESIPVDTSIPPTENDASSVGTSARFSTRFSTLAIGVGVVLLRT